MPIISMNVVAWPAMFYLPHLYFSISNLSVSDSLPQGWEKGITNKQIAWKSIGYKFSSQSCMVYTGPDLNDWLTLLREINMIQILDL